MRTPKLALIVLLVLLPAAPVFANPGVIMSPRHTRMMGR